jgi:UDP-2,4-diacetamido-2,4,6-trideoxy-beta-L-altropyranose hydrolase
VTSVAFLTTSGARAGLGHLRRCLTLAHAIQAAGAEVRFVLTGDEPGVALVQRAGFVASLVEGGARAAVARLVDEEARQLVVADDYALESDDLAELSRVALLAVLDDLADRDLPAHFVLNANPAADALPYRMPPTCTRLFGPRYALLGPAFENVAARRTSERARRVLVTVGGADPRGVTLEITAAVRDALPDAIIDVVIGPLFDQATIASLPAGCVAHHAPATLAPLMFEADMAVTAGGQTTYELAACGLPAVAVCLAENQRPNLAALAVAGTLTTSELVDLSATVAALSFDSARRARMSAAGRALVDGYGATRAAKELLAHA